MNEEKAIAKRRLRRRRGVRKKLRGSAQRPRLCICRSHKHLSCQLIDDVQGVTLASAGTRDKELAAKIKYGGNKAAAELVGKSIAAKALAIGVQHARFDRGHCKYHGRVAEVADAVRKAGLQL